MSINWMNSASLPVPILHFDERFICTAHTFLKIDSAVCWVKSIYYLISISHKAQGDAQVIEINIFWFASW